MKKKPVRLKKITHILDEQQNIYLPVIDRIGYFKKKSKKSSAILFKKSRQTKRRVLRKYRGKKKTGKRIPPVPGGVGYGVYYKQNFQWSFSNFSCLDFGILTPAAAGGNSTGFLYLTATNGTAKGVEALISFFQQESPQFKIFDWAKSENNKWSLSIDCSTIPENFSTKIINGINHSYCRVLNKTEMTAPNIWENKVCLFNFIGNNWDLIYNYQYQCTLTEQKNVFNGSWGPIVETFQDFFSNINPMGFCDSLLYNDNTNVLLKPSNTTIRDDNDGIDIVFKLANHTFYVT